MTKNWTAGLTNDNMNKETNQMGKKRSAVKPIRQMEIMKGEASPLWVEAVRIRHIHNKDTQTSFSKAREWSKRMSERCERTSDWTSGLSTHNVQSLPAPPENSRQNEKYDDKTEGDERR